MVVFRNVRIHSDKAVCGRIQTEKNHAHSLHIANIQKGMFVCECQGYDINWGDYKLNSQVRTCTF